MQKEICFNCTEDIVVVGTGISALALINTVSNYFPDSGITHISTDIPQVSASNRFSIPIVKNNVLDQLGIDTQEHKKIIRREVFVDDDLSPFGLVALSLINFQLNTNLDTNPLYFLDINLAQEQMANKIKHRQNVRRIHGKVMSIETNDSKITSLNLDTQKKLRDPNIVIDATGRQARIATLVNSIMPGSINVTKKKKQSLFKGGFVKFNDTFINEFPSIEDTASIFFLANGIIGALAPSTHTSNGSTTHAFYFEGSPETMVTGNKNVESGNQGFYSGLLKSTPFEHFARGIESIDRHLFFEHKFDVSRTISNHLLNLILIGDAQTHSNPLIGTGFRNILLDIEAIISGIDSGNIIKSYNSLLNPKEKIKKTKAYFRYLSADITSRIFQNFRPYTTL